MTGYILRRLMVSVPVLFGMSAIVFASLHLVPGDPLVAIIGSAPVDLQTQQELRRLHGLDQPLPIQYAMWLSGVLSGDLGSSIQYRQPVAEVIGGQLGATVQLTIAALFMSTVLGVALGTLAAMKVGSTIDGAISTLSSVGLAIPTFWLGLMLLLVFSLALGWFPSSGSSGPERLVLPAATLAIGGAAIITRFVRESLSSELGRPYMDTGRAKGLSERRLVVTHGLPNALIPVVTVVGLQFGSLLAGAVVVELIFARQGIGKVLLDAILSRDFPVVQGVVLLTTIAYVVINILVDVLYTYLDPRLRVA